MRPTGAGSPVDVVPAAAPEVTVRDVRPDDVAAIAAIYAPYVVGTSATFETEPPDDAGWRARVHAVTDAGWPFLVAVDDDGAVLGYAYVGPWRPRPAYRHTVEDTIYLAPSATGRGIGTALLGSLLARAEAAGAREVVAVIADGGSGASEALHRAAGFREVGRLEGVGYKLGRWLGTTLMQRSLRPGSNGTSPQGV